MADKRWVRLLGGGLILGVTLTMAACSTDNGNTTSTGTPTASDTSTNAATDLPINPTPTDAPTGSTSWDGIEVTGGFGEEPEVTVPAPWAAQSTMTKVLVQGDGNTVGDTGYVQVDYYGVNARTGEMFDESYSSGAPMSLPLTGVVPGFQKGLTGQKTGSRVVIAMPGADGYDSQGGQSDAGIEIGDTLIFVVDVVRAQFMGPVGETVTPTDSNLPTVSGPLTAPVITMPAGVTAPTAATVQVLVQGAGPVVEAGDYIHVDYAEYIWATGTMVRQTYGFAPLTGALDATLAGWQTALIGQNMGSRLLIVLPASDSYPQGNPKMGIPPNSTMVYVIDVLYAAAS
jgi:peptidylprolyl isomerase